MVNTYLNLKLIRILFPPKILRMYIHDVKEKTACDCFLA